MQRQRVLRRCRVVRVSAASRPARAFTVFARAARPDPFVRYLGIGARRGCWARTGMPVLYDNLREVTLTASSMLLPPTSATQRLPGRRFWHRDDLRCRHAQGRVPGGAIAPELASSADALFHAASSPRASIWSGRSVMWSQHGGDECSQTGLSLALVDGIVERMRSE